MVACMHQKVLSICRKIIWQRFGVIQCKEKIINNFFKITIMANTKTLLGFLAGAAVGALAGILLAPDKGSETRRKISEKGTDLADGLKNKFNDFVDSVTEKFQGAKDEAASMANKGKEQFEEWKGNTQNAM